MNLEELQIKIKKAGLDALYITRNNMFIGQDILDEENNIFELVGFSGSSGELIVTTDKAYLFTDGRYEIQAKQEVDEEKVEVYTSVSDFYNFLKIFKKDKKIKLGFNPWTTSIERYAHLENVSVHYRKDAPIVLIPSELMCSAQQIKKPQVFELDVEFAGSNMQEKIEQMINYMSFDDLEACFITDAANASWLLNLRSNYLPNSPIVRAYALIDKNKTTTIFSDDFEKFEGTNVLPLSKIENELKKYKNKKINFDKNSPQALKIIADKYKIKTTNFFDICNKYKAQKNDVEIINMKKAHLKDGIAVTKLLYWLAHNWQGKTELDVVKKLYELRKEQEYFFSNSFDTIAGFGKNGAIVHYHPTKETNLELKGNSFLLLDSGGQYFDGTTDVTRTIPLGEVSQEMKNNYTLVLKSHIALANSYFPENANGAMLDAIARKPLWKEGKDYSHGTGHGVGFFLNVHEGPVSISPREGHYPLFENLVVSIEPGYYKENEYGIRIENLYIVKDVTDLFFEKRMLGFEALTLIPIETKILNLELMTKEEINWVKNYNKTVYDKISLYLSDNEKNWLLEKI